MSAAYVRNTIKSGQEADSALVMAIHVSAWACEVMYRYTLPVLIEKRLAIECPRVYDAHAQKGDQNTSIIPLSLVVGAIAGRLAWSVTQFFPRDWKGTLDGETFIRERIMPALSAEEHARAQLPAASLAHNVWDGIGIGLKHLGRLEPRRTFHKEQ